MMSRMRERREVRRGGWLLALALASLAGPTAGPGRAAGLGNRVEPAQVVPLDQLPAHRRGAVVEVIQGAQFHRKGKPDTFPAHPRLYLGLLADPALTLALWGDLGPTPAQLQPVAPGVYQGSDGEGTAATWEILVQSPRLHVYYADVQYTSPRGAAKLDGRLVVVVRTAYFRDQADEPWVRHEIEIFVRVDSRGWKAVAATLRPVLERVMDDQVEEAGLFISLMARLVETYPDWATEVAGRAPTTPEARAAFVELVRATRRPGAFTGRPVVADRGAAPPPGTGLRR